MARGATAREESERAREMSVIERTLRATTVRRTQQAQAKSAARDRPSSARGPGSARGSRPQREEEPPVASLRADEKVEFLQERLAQLQRKGETERQEKQRLQETLRLLRKKVSTIALDHEKEAHDLRRVHAEELMLLEVSVEERLAADMDARITAVQAEVKASQDHAVRERAEECEQAFVQSDVLRTRLGSEREATQALRSEQAEVVAGFLSELEAEKSRTRAEALGQAEEALKHYQALAQETVESARQERQRLQAESLHASHLAETACQSFEEEVQARTREIIDQYRQMARQAQAEAAQEQQVLRARLLELERTAEQQRLELDRRVEQESEQRLEHFTGAVKHKTEKLHALRMDFQRVVTDMLQEVEQNCKSFEAETKQKAIEVIGRWRHVAEDLRSVMDSEREACMVRELRWISMLQSNQRPTLK